MPKVSVLIPTYNTKLEYLKESIESILNQTFKDFELIILDDGSKEDISDFISSFNDKRIRFYKNENNLGVAKSRNKLLKLAKGEYCAWQDSDDISAKERLEKQVKFLDENRDISVVGANIERFPSKRVIEFFPNPKLLNFIGGCSISQGVSMFRIADLREHQLFYNENLVTSEDYDLWSRVVTVLKIANIQDILLKYRRVGTSLCHSKNKCAFEIDKNIKTKLLNTITEDKKLQNKILKVVSNYYSKKTGFFENIFSVRNAWHGENKVKILVLFGLKFKIKKLG